MELEQPTFLRAHYSPSLTKSAILKHLGATSLFTLKCIQVTQCLVRSQHRIYAGRTKQNRLKEVAIRNNPYSGSKAFSPHHTVFEGN